MARSRFSVTRKPRRPRRPHNPAEGQCWDELVGEDWQVMKRGWPDFFCTNDRGEIMLVEVKPFATHDLKIQQKQVMKALAAYGVPCYRWDPEDGLRPIEMDDID